MSLNLINEYDAYVTFSTMRLFFNGKYNMKSGDLSRVFTPEKFKRENKVGMFKLLADKYQTKKTLALASASNLVRNPLIYANDMVGNKAYQNYLEFKSWSATPSRTTILEYERLLAAAGGVEISNQQAMVEVTGGRLHAASYCLLNRASAFKDDGSADNYLTKIMSDRLQRMNRFVIVSEVHMEDVNYTIYTKTLNLH